MNINLLISGAISVYGIYVVANLVASSSSMARFFGFNLNKWIVVAIWCAIIFSSVQNLYRWYKHQQRRG